MSLIGSVLAGLGLGVRLVETVVVVSRAGCLEAVLLPEREDMYVKEEEDTF